jgi:cyclopropane-fatty-acyl-phospholipid synthase
VNIGDTVNSQVFLQRLLEPTGILLTESESRFAAESGPAIFVRDRRFYGRVLRHANLGFTESYMDGWTELRAIDQIYERVFRSEIALTAHSPLAHKLHILRSLLTNMQTPRRAKRDTNAHYDLSNEMFLSFLGRAPLYTCGYWSRDDMSVEQANRAAFDLTCRKLELQPDHRLLDSGCGWGALLEHAARNFGVSGLGVNISERQLEVCRDVCKDLPVEFLLEDCRFLDTHKYAGHFDAVSSIAVINHIGPKNYRQFFATCHAVLKEGGLFILQGIANRKPTFTNDAFMHKYIFANAACPSLSQLLAPAESFFTLEDFHNFTHFYPRTLRAWNAAFQEKWPRIRGGQFDERFRRMWEIYLLSAAGTCSAKEVIIFQAVFSKGRRQHLYSAVR